MNKLKQAWMYLLIFAGNSLYGGSTTDLMDQLTSKQSSGSITKNIIDGGTTLAQGAFTIILILTVVAGFALAITGGFKFAKSKQENQGEGVEGAMKAIGGGLFLILISYVIYGITSN